MKKDYIVELREEEADELMDDHWVGELVRCEHCQYSDDFDCPAPLPTGYLCQKGHGSHTGNWFCADGEPKDGGEVK